MRRFRSCFCLPNKRKKLPSSSSSSISSRYARRSSYRPLASFLEDDDDPDVVSNPGESGVTRKKVRFDLNVQAYEPIPREDSDCMESEAEEIVGWERCEETTPIIASGERSAYPSNYRYRNCRDSSDEEDYGFFYTDSDLQFEHDEDDYFCDDEGRGDCCQLNWRSSKDEVPNRLDSACSSSEGQEQCSLVEFPEEKKINPVHPLSTTTNEREPCATTRSSENARLRNNYAHLVLNPVENTVQRKTVKARATLSDRKPNKEKMEREKEFQSALTSCKSNFQAQHIRVNASLSSWLVPVEH